MSGLRENRRGLDHHHHVKRAKVIVFSPTASYSDSGPTDSPSATPADVPFTTSSPSSSPTPDVPAATSASSTDTSSSSSSSSSSTFTSTSSSSTTPLSSSTISSASDSVSRVQHASSIASPVTSVTRITQYTHASPSSNTSSATASTTVAPASNTSTSAIVGGIAAGLVGLAGLIFVIMFLLRRWRKRGQDEDEFNADAFKRQSAILIDDDQVPYGSGRSGFNPRPPTMIERHIASRSPFDAPPMPSLQQYNNMGAGAGSGYGNEYDYPTAPQQSFNPGQVMPSPTSPPPPTQTGMQFFAPYGQSPLNSPGPYDSAYNDNGQVVRQPSNGAVFHKEQGQLAGQPSTGMRGDLSRQDSVGGNANYIDLDRSSVTPFQAAQYAEISRQLNTKAPGSLNPVNEDEERAHYANGYAISRDNANQSSPFTDLHDAQDAQDLVPPSPIYSMNSTKASRDRVLSNPPQLPDFQAQGRTFSPTSYDFPQTPSALPSPSAANFNIPSPRAAERFPNGLTPGAAGTSSAHNVAASGKNQRPASTYTVYDENDAYGGF